MKRSELFKLYETVYEKDPKSGKEKPVSRYIGPWYLVDSKKKRRLAIKLWLGWLIALAAFLTAGLIPSWATMCNYVAPWYILCLAPLFYLLLSAWRVTRMKARITMIQKGDALSTGLYASLGLTCLGFVWMVTTVVFLCTASLTMTMTQELIFLGCGLITTAVGGFLTWTLRRFTVEEETAE